jgi:hypothetical protein
MKTSLLIATALIVLAGLALLAATVLKIGKPNRLINVSFDELKNMENRDR